MATIADKLYSQLRGKVSYKVNSKAVGDRAVLIDCKSGKTNLAVGWIDYIKVYDYVPYSLILEITKPSGIANNAVKLMEKSMGTWSMQLKYCGVI